MVSTLSSQSGYPLKLDSFFWNKYSKLRKKSWGGAVTEMTLLVNNTRMPIIRKPNYSETTYNVSMDTVPITVGNQSKDGFIGKEVISLREYLSNFSRYQSTPEINDNDELKTNDKTSKISLLCSEKKENDNTVIMDTMSCLLPINSVSGCSEFMIATLNWKSGLKNPSCLYIVSTVNGTSSVIIEGNFQKVYCNKNGFKAPFVVDINNDNDRNQCIKIIQVPLRQKSRQQIEEEQALNSSWGITNWWSSNTDQKKGFSMYCRQIAKTEWFKIY